MNQPAGWYPDPAQDGRRRWWTGSAWTNETMAAEPPPSPAKTRRLTRQDQFASLFLALFFGLFNGVLLLYTLGAHGPTTTEDATLRTIERSTGTGTRSTTYHVAGTTDSGRSWRIASREAYDAARRDGYPMRVEITFSDWADVAVQLRGETFERDLRSTAHRVAFPLANVASTVVALGAAVFAGRTRLGLVTTIAILVGFAAGTWLGLPMARWIRS